MIVSDGEQRWDDIINHLISQYRTALDDGCDTDTARQALFTLLGSTNHELASSHRDYQQMMTLVVLLVAKHVETA